MQVQQILCCSLLQDDEPLQGFKWHLINPDGVSQGCPTYGSWAISAHFGFFGGSFSYLQISRAFWCEFHEFNSLRVQCTLNVCIVYTSPLYWVPAFVYVCRVVFLWHLQSRIKPLKIGWIRSHVIQFFICNYFRVLLVKIHVRGVTKPELSSQPWQISSWSERLLGGLYAWYVTRHKPITSRVIFRDIVTVHPAILTVGSLQGLRNAKKEYRNWS